MTRDYDPHQLRVSDGVGHDQPVEGVHARMWRTVTARLDAVAPEQWRLSADACNAQEAALMLTTDRGSRDPQFAITFRLAQGLQNPPVVLVAGKDAIDTHLSEFAARVAPETQDLYYPVTFTGEKVNTLYHRLCERLAAFHTLSAADLEELRMSREWT